ncbi:MAG: hypothetical protein SFX74_10570 [Fimbriimonadaceae bacterium]|nr:hypothetical protein [Fimbriimonadaceae bacterium]
MAILGLGIQAGCILFVFMLTLFGGRRLDGILFEPVILWAIGVSSLLVVAVRARIQNQLVSGSMSLVILIGYFVYATGGLRSFDFIWPYYLHLLGITLFLCGPLEFNKKRDYLDFGVGIVIPILILLARSVFQTPSQKPGLTLRQISRSQVIGPIDISRQGYVTFGSIGDPSFRRVLEALEATRKPGSVVRFRLRQTRTTLRSRLEFLSFIRAVQKSPTRKFADIHDGIAAGRQLLPFTQETQIEVADLERDRFESINLPLSGQNALVSCPPYEGCVEIDLP